MKCCTTEKFFSLEEREGLLPRNQASATASDDKVVETFLINLKFGKLARH